MSETDRDTHTQALLGAGQVSQQPYPLTLLCHSHTQKEKERERESKREMERYPGRLVRQEADRNRNDWMLEPDQVQDVTCSTLNSTQRCL